MDEQTKELIAIGASFTANCEPCVEYHVARARQVGASEADIRSAIGVGRMVRKGAAGRFDQFIESSHKAPGVQDTSPSLACGA